MDEKSKIGSRTPSLAALDVVHHMSRVPEWAWNGTAVRTDDWSKVTCGSCKLERPAEKSDVVHYLPGNQAELGRKEATYACGKRIATSLLGDGEWTFTWRDVTCGYCKLEFPATKPKEYVVPANVLERDRSDGTQGAKFVRLVYGTKLDNESFKQARQRVLDSLHAEALLEDAQRAPSAWLKKMAVRSEKLALLGEERQMQRKIDRMIDDLSDLREKSGLRASQLFKEIRELS